VLVSIVVETVEPAAVEAEEQAGIPVEGRVAVEVGGSACIQAAEPVVVAVAESACIQAAEPVGVGAAEQVSTQVEDAVEAVVAEQVSTQVEDAVEAVVAEPGGFQAGVVEVLGASRAVLDGFEAGRDGPQAEQVLFRIGQGGRVVAENDRLVRLDEFPVEQPDALWRVERRWAGEPRRPQGDLC